jgi:hypothetical protein
MFIEIAPKGYTFAEILLDPYLLLQNHERISAIASKQGS